MDVENVETPKERPATEPESEQPAAGVPRTARTVASPVAAAVFAGGISYAWLEALWRLLYTYFPTFNNDWLLWNGRPGDVAAMWLTISGLAAVVGVGSYLLWRRKDHVGTILDWTAVLIASAIAAPMIGEIGQTTGSVSNGVGSTDGNAIIAYVLLAIAAAGAGVVMAVSRRSRVERAGAGPSISRAAPLERVAERTDSDTTAPTATQPSPVRALSSHEFVMRSCGVM